MLTFHSNSFIDFRYMRSDVRHTTVVKPINPYARITFCHVTIQGVKLSAQVLEERQFFQSDNGQMLSLDIYSADILRLSLKLMISTTKHSQAFLEHHIQHNKTS